MQCSSHKAALSVGTPIQIVNVQLKVNNAMRAMVLITILLCAKRRDAGNSGRSSRGFKPNKRSSSRGCRASHSPHRHRGRNHRSHSHSRTPSCSPSCSPTHGTSPRHSSCSKKCSTSHRYYQDSIDIIPADSITTGSQAEGMLFTERASDSQVAFYTRLDLPA